MNSRYLIHMGVRSLIVAVSACTVFAMEVLAQDDASWEGLRAAALARPRTFVYNTDGNDAHNWPSNLPVNHHRLILPAQLRVRAPHLPQGRRSLLREVASREAARLGRSLRDGD